MKTEREMGRDLTQSYDNRLSTTDNTVKQNRESTEGYSKSIVW